MKLVAVIKDGEVINMTVGDDPDFDFGVEGVDGLLIDNTDNGKSIGKGWKRKPDGKFEPPQKPELPPQAGGQ